MSEIIASKSSRKTQSKFEKLMARAAKLRTQNAQFAADLDAIVVRMESTVRPKEAELATQQLPLLKKLLTLGQRKTMAHWQRDILDEWIRDLSQMAHEHQLINPDLLDDFARYDAFRMGIALEDDSIPAHEQLVEAVEQAEAEAAEALEKQQQQQQKRMAEFRDTLMLDAEQEVELELHRLLGPEPEQPQAQTESHASSKTQDMWADERDTEQQRRYDEYQQKRNTLRNNMLSARRREINAMLGLEDDAADSGNDDDANEFGDDYFESSEDKVHHGSSGDGDGDGAGPDPFHTAANDPTDAGRHQVLSNETFQRLFRAAASKLHPDREPDPELRQEKQKLMANLLLARKKGDVMTVLALYEAHVGTHEGFSKSDQDALTASLEQMLDELENEQQDIVYQSPAHSAAFHIFYHGNIKKVDAAFAKHMRELKTQQTAIKHQVASITSLKSLKPELEARYDAMDFGRPTFEEMMMMHASD